MLRLLVALFITALCAACGDPSPTAPFRTPQGMAGGGAFPGAGGMGGGMDPVLRSEFDYLARMIPHHEEAIVAARVLEHRTSREEMRRFARTIIATQSAEVEQMRVWLAAWHPGRDATVEYQPMMRDLSSLSGDALDRAFLDDMIPHHRMAVMMSQQLIVNGHAVHAEIVPFAAKIRDVQHAEIQTMIDWLRDWFGAAPPMGH